MSNMLYLSCETGISADMVVGALLDLGANQERLEQALSSLPLDGYKVKISKKQVSGIVATDFDVELDEENHDHDMAWLYGDLDAVVLSYTNGATRYLAVFGTIKDGEAFYDNTIATSTGAVSAGSSVVVTLDAPPVAVPVGAKVYLWDDASCEICTVVSKDATTVTLATVGTSKATGCRLAGDQCYFVNSQSNAGYLASVSNRTTGTAAGAPQYTLNAGLFSALNAVEILNSKRIAEPVAIGSASGVYGALPHIKKTGSSGATHGDTYTDTDGTAYRVLVASSDAYLIREV